MKRSGPLHVEGICPMHQHLALSVLGQPGGPPCVPWDDPFIIAAGRRQALGGSGVLSAGNGHGVATFPHLPCGQDDAISLESLEGFPGVIRNIWQSSPRCLSLTGGTPRLGAVPPCLVRCGQVKRL